MGQTLTHGIYLPDEGERNCYNGLAANWQLLDGAVGTIAEHSTQISGKANAVHTHSKADITDFPALANVATSGSYNDLSNIPASFTPASHSHGNITNDGKVGTAANKPLITGTGGVVQAGSFGNAANTFCEGNDSRLSDARTPVAHMHTKSDVTDLLNSNFIPSANNSYDLGSSSYQWNNLYAQSYYYNGTEFQSKFATLDTDQTITGVKTLTNYWHLQAKNLKAGEGETYGRTGYSFLFTDKNDVTMGDVTLFKNANAARTFIRIRGGDYYTNGTPAATGTLVQSALIVGTNVSGKKIIECDSDIVYPTTNNTTDLGTSTNKWKTLNGINPGALSFFDTSSEGDIINTNNWSTNGGVNEYTPTENGWVYFRIAGVSGNYIVIRYQSQGQNYPTISQEAVSLHLSVCAPAIAGIKMYIYIIGSIEKAYFYPALGNV